MGNREGLFRAPGLLWRSTSDRLWQPAADIYRTREGWVVKFDLAGVEPDDLSVSVSNCNLIVRGIRRDRTLTEGAYHYHMEITYSRFERVLSLPCDLTTAEIRTEYDRGLLTVTFLTETKGSEKQDE
jgi:HSP20 family protein